MQIYDYLKNDLQSLGIKNGDTVLVRGNLAKVGRIKKDLFINTLLETVGKEGTIVTLAFTKSFAFYKMNKQYIFDVDSVPTTGALGKAFLEHPSSVRSSHPTNSFLAIGKMADFIMKDHNEEELSYTPMKKLVALNAKLLNFGIISESPGFTTVHLVQEELGLTRKSLLKNFLRVYYKASNNEVKLFKRKDLGGCSDGFSKFYKYYMDEGKLTYGKLGKAAAIMINAQDSYNIELDLMKENPSFHFCDNPLCFTCRCTWKYDLKYLPNYLILKVISMFKKEKR